MKSVDRQKLLVVGAVAVLGLLLADKILISPLTDIWKDRSERIKTLKVDVIEGRQLMDRASALNSRWSDMRSSSLPRVESNASIDVANAFYRWLDASNVNPEGIRADWKSVNEKDGDDYQYKYQTYECRATVSGTISQLTRFIYELETDPLALRVVDLTFAPRDERGNQLALTVLFSGLMLTSDN